MKYIKFLTTSAIFLVGIFFALNINAQDAPLNLNEAHLHMFYGQGCPHCGSLKLFLDDIKPKYPSLVIYEHEIYQNQKERELFEAMSNSFNVPIQGVPTVFIDDKVIVGFSNTIGESIEKEIKRCLVVDCKNPEFKQATSETMQLIGDSSPSVNPENKQIM